MKIVNNISSSFKMNNLSILLIFLFPVFIWSVVSPRNFLTWSLEFMPLFIGIIVLLKSHKVFSFSPFSYIMIFIGSILILIGAHYTYAHVPFSDWIKSDFGLQRNDYDKLGHFFQGFIIAIIAREIFLKKKIISSLAWVNTTAVMFSIALSAIWEILEWFGFSVFVYFSLAKSASQFLGTQGYIWDSQSDIFCATIGAIIATTIFGKYHDKFIYS